MANILIYDPSDPDVPNRVTEYIESAHTPDYNGVTDKLVNPDVSGLTAVAVRHWKVNGATVEEMTPSEKITIDGTLPKPVRGVHNILTFAEIVMTPSWKTVRRFVYEGSDKVGEPQTIEIIGYADSGVTGDFRLIDKDNNNLLGSATFTNNTEETIAVTIVNDWPNDSTIVELQVKRTVGTGKEKVFLNGMLLGY